MFIKIILTRRNCCECQLIFFPSNLQHKNQSSTPLNLFDINQDFNKPCTCILRRKQWKEEQHKNVHIYLHFLLSSLLSFNSLWEEVQFIAKAIHKHLHFRPSNLYTIHNNTLPKIQFCQAIAKLESTRLCYPNILLSRVLIHEFKF